MEPWQQRVVNERDVLTARIAALRTFLQGDLEQLDDEGLDLLRRQLEVMVRYEEILNRRIERFSDAA